MSVKCEFCEISLKSDLSVSQHLASQTHRSNFTKFQSLRPLEKEKVGDKPRNIVKVFESLKLRTKNDVRDLADRGFFHIPANSPQALNVVDQLNNVLAKHIACHITKNLPSAIQKTVMDGFGGVKREQSVASKPQETQPAGMSVSRTSSSPATMMSSPSSKLQAPGSSGISLTDFAQPTVQAPGNPQRVFPLLSTTTEETRPNVAIRMVRPNTHTTVNQTNNPSTDSRHTIPARLAQSHVRLTQPISSAPHPSRTPMMGASFMPRPLLDEPPPQPRPDSTYRPRLAQIKLEPKDP